MGCTKVFCLVFVLISAISTIAEELDGGVTFTPTDYDLQIYTTEDHYKDSDKNLTFEGKVVIKTTKSGNGPFQVKIDATTKTELLETKVYGVKTNSTETLLTDCDGKVINDKIVIKCQKSYTEYNTVKFSLRYRTPFGNDMTGFYRSSYRSSQNETRWILTTHFEPIFARKAFPCFDKPNLKANYVVSISIPKTRSEYFVLGNTPCNKSSQNDKEIIYTCSKTRVPLSSYLIAFVVSDFKCIRTEFPSENKKKYITTCGRENTAEEEGGISLTAGRDAIVALANYLNKDYTYEKVDQVGIPDFSAGAMENWGLITYREKILFFNEKTGSSLTKQSNILTVTHELVHQWFGNLVTLESWDYIWLNEAFATYLGYVISDKVREPNTKDWGYTKQLLINEIHLRAFESDALSTSKPLNCKIEDENLIFSYFNDIPYSKGTAVIRMWDLADQTLFQKSLQKYIANREGKAAHPRDLYAAFKEVAKMDADNFNVWTETPGYPVVEVKSEKGNYILSQTRFLWEKKKDESKYEVPITYSTDKQIGSTKPQCWLKKNGSSCILPNVEGKWILINNQQAGYYRVNYEKKNWIALTEALNNKNFSGIPELNRAQVVNDVFSLARSLQKEYVHYCVAMNLSLYLKNENSFIVWKTALNTFDFLQTKLYKNDKIYEAFKSHVLKLLAPHFVTLDCEKLTHIEKLKAIEISRWACSLNYKPCVDKALEFYYISTRLPPDTQETILCTVVRTQKGAANQILEKYERESDSAIKVMYLGALGCTDDQNFAKEYLNKTLDPKSNIRKQDVIYVLMSVYNGNLKNVRIALNFINDNYLQISREYGGINPLGRSVLGIAKKLNTEEDLKIMKTLAEKIKKNPETKPAIESVDNAISIIESNINWIKERQDQLNSCLTPLS